jgi:hypothetical protein
MSLGHQFLYQTTAFVSIVTTEHLGVPLTNMLRVKAECSCSVQGCSMMEPTTAEREHYVLKRPSQNALLQKYELSFIGGQFDSHKT